MKGNKILAILWVLIAILLTIILVAKLNGLKDPKLSKITHSIHSDNKGNTYIDVVKNINSIDINLLSEALEIQETTDSKISVQLVGFENNEPDVTVVSNTLKIQSKKKIKVNFVTFQRKVIVKLPKGIELSDVDFTCTSGSIKINNCIFTNIHVNSTSGSVSVYNCKADKFDVRCASGSITFDECAITNIEAKSESGSIKVDGNYKGIELRSTSGSIKANLNEPLIQDSELCSTSGSVHLTLPPESGFKVKYNVVSGTYKNSITGTSGKKGNETVNGGGPLVELQSASGSIHIN